MSDQDDMVKVLDQDKLPCGCITGRALVNGEKTMYYTPCSESCVNYQNFMKLAWESEKPIHRREPMSRDYGPLDDRFHHGRTQYGCTPEEYADPDREIWCPLVNAWMTQAEHERRFRFKIGHKEEK